MASQITVRASSSGHNVVITNGIMTVAFPGTPQVDDPIGIWITSNTSTHRVNSVPSGWTIQFSTTCGSGSRHLVTKDKYASGDGTTVALTLEGNWGANVASVGVIVFDGTKHTGFGTFGTPVQRTPSGTITTAAAQGSAGDGILYAFHEKTTSQTTMTTTVSSGASFTDIISQLPISGQSGSIVVGTYDSTAGTSSVTESYALAGNTNAYGYQVTLVKASPSITATSGFAKLHTDGTTEKPVRVTAWDGTTEKVISGFRVNIGPRTIANSITTATSSKPFYCAHRYGSKNWPEFTIFSAKESANRMVPGLETSFWVTTDGVRALSHDKSTLRTTGTDLDITTQTWATLSAMNINPVNTDNQAQAAKPFARLEQIMSMYGEDHVHFLEDKQGTNYAALITYLSTIPNATSRFVIKIGGPGYAPAKVAYRAAGFKMWGYYFAGGDMTSLASTYSAVDYLGLDYNLSDSDFAAATTYGLPVIAHIIPNTTQRDRVLSLGAIGCMVSDVKAVIPGAAAT